MTILKNVEYYSLINKQLGWPLAVLKMLSSIGLKGTVLRKKTSPAEKVPQTLQTIMSLFIFTSQKLLDLGTKTLSRVMSDRRISPTGYLFRVTCFFREIDP